jgi:hypothetical protein
VRGRLGRCGDSWLDRLAFKRNELSEMIPLIAGPTPIPTPPAR